MNHNKTHAPRLLHASLLTLILLLTGCGGGGGGGSDVPGDTSSTGGNGGSGDAGNAIPEAARLDTSFGKDNDGDGTKDGWTVHVAPQAADGNQFYPEDAIQDADGNILVVGSMLDYSKAIRRMALWRLTSDGALDTSFGDDYDGDGVQDGYWLGSDSVHNEARSITLSRAGKILITGYTETSARVWRRLNDGSPDFNFPQFPGTGYLDLPDPGDDGASRGFGIIEDRNNRIVVAGFATRTGDHNRHAIVWRLIYKKPDSLISIGSWQLDDSFGNNGRFIDPGSEDGDEKARALIEDSHGRLVIVGEKYNAISSFLRTSEDSMQDMTVWRLDANGFPDSSFGLDVDQDGTPDGVFFHHNAAGGNGGDGAYDLIAMEGNSQATDSLAIVGYSVNWTRLSWDAAVWMVSETGSLLTSFNNGFVTLAAPDSTVQVARAITRNSDTRELLVLGSNGLLKSELLLWRIDPANGDLKGETRFAPFDAMIEAASILSPTPGEITAIAYSDLGSSMSWRGVLAARFTQ